MLNTIKILIVMFFVMTAFFFGSHIFSDNYKLSIASIFQNESPYLKEWIDYHKKKGVEHFWLYNNNSTDNYLYELFPYIRDGSVTLVNWPSHQQLNDWANFSFTVQTGAYNDAIQRAKGVSKWLALIDIDEFIVPVMYETIIDLLETEFPSVSGLCVNWQCYGTSYISHIPDGQLLNNLVWKMRWNHDWNKHSKSIVQPTHVTNCVNPHYCLYSVNNWAVDARGIRCDECPDSIYIDQIRLNHYWTRDEWFLYNVKIPRYQKWGGDINGVLLHAEEMNEEYDPILQEVEIGK